MYFYLKNPNLDRETSINTIIYVKSEKRNFKRSTGLKIHPKDWDPRNRMPKKKKGNVKLKKIYKKLEEISDSIEEVFNTLNVTSELLEEALSGKKESKRLIYLLDDFIEANESSKGTSSTWKLRYELLKTNLANYDSHAMIGDVSQDWLLGYVGHLRRIPYNDNTAHRAVIFLFTFLNWARTKYSIPKLKNPVDKFTPDKVHLTFEEVRKIEEVELRPSLDRIRDLFLLGVYSGQRFSDYSVFERADVVGDMIVKKAEKTEFESFIPLIDKMRAILDKYDWDLPKISGQKFNPKIKRICEKAGIKEKVKVTNYWGNEKKTEYSEKWELVESHTARRTYITLASEKSIPDEVIMKVTGIRDIKTLYKYKKTSQRSVMEQAKGLFD